MACGYSPEEAHDPCKRICRETTFCSGKVTSGEMLPISVTVPPLRTQSMAAETVSVAADGFKGYIHADSASQLFTSRSYRSPEPSRIHLLPACASFRRVASTSATKTREHPAAFAACSVSSPIMPAPITSAVSPPFDFGPAPRAAQPKPPQAWRLRQREISGRWYRMRSGHCDELGKGAGAAIVAAGDTDHLAVIAQVDVATQADSHSPQ